MSEVEAVSVRDVFGKPDIPAGVKVKRFADATHPLIPITHPEYIIRNELLRDVLAFLSAPCGDGLYLTGPTGTGKTSFINEVAGRMNWPVSEVKGHGRLEFADLVGHHALVSEKPGEPPYMKFVYGVVPEAVRNGHILLINEADAIEPGEFAGFNDLLEGKPLVIAENGGEVIRPHPMFRLIVTGNTAGRGDASGLYQGTAMQNLATMDRFRFVQVGYPDPEDEKALLQAAVPSLPATVLAEMVHLAAEVRRLFAGGGDGGSQIGIVMTTRGLLRWARLAVQFRGAPNTLEYALNQALLTRAEPEEREAILRIAKDCFGDQWK